MLLDLVARCGKKYSFSTRTITFSDSTCDLPKKQYPHRILVPDTGSLKCADCQYMSTLTIQEASNFALVFRFFQLISRLGQVTRRTCNAPHLKPKIGTRATATGADTYHASKLLVEEGIPYSKPLLSQVTRSKKGSWRQSIVSSEMFYIDSAELDAIQNSLLKVHSD